MSSRAFEEANVSAVAAPVVPPDAAVAVLREFAETWAEVESGGPEERAALARLIASVYERVTVKGREVVEVELTQTAYAQGFAPALPERVEWVRARPTGVGRAITTYVILIVGRDEWLAAARRLA